MSSNISSSSLRSEQYYERKLLKVFIDYYKKGGTNLYITEEYPDQTNEGFPDFLAKRRNSNTTYAIEISRIQSQKMHLKSLLNGLKNTLQEVKRSALDIKFGFVIDLLQRNFSHRRDKIKKEIESVKRWVKNALDEYRGYVGVTTPWDKNGERLGYHLTVFPKSQNKGQQCWLMCWGNKYSAKGILNAINDAKKKLAKSKCDKGILILTGVGHSLVRKDIPTTGKSNLEKTNLDWAIIPLPSPLWLEDLITHLQPFAITNKNLEIYSLYFDVTRNVVDIVKCYPAHVVTLEKYPSMIATEEAIEFIQNYFKDELFTIIE